MTSEGSNRNCKPGYRILSLVLALVLIIPFAAGCKASGGPSGGASDGEENSNFMSMYGTVAHYDGYTYYIQSGFDNDASVTGTSYSDNIYRISDDRDAEPELIYSVPADMVYGVEAGDYASYLDIWQKFIIRWNEVLPELPLYSNVYVTVYPNTIENYNQTSFCNFEQAILYAKYVGE